MNYKKVFFSALFLLFFQITESQSPKLILPIGHTSSINTARFSPNGKRIITASVDGTAKLWDVNSGKLLADLKDHLLGVVSANFSPDGQKILTVSPGSNCVNMYSAVTGALLYSFKERKNSMNDASFTPDGKKIATVSGNTWSSSYNNFLNVWNTYDGSPVFSTRIDSSGISKVEFSPACNTDPIGGKIIAVVVPKLYKIILIEAATGKQLRSLRGHTGRINFIKFSPDGKKIVTCSTDKTIKIWDVETGAISMDLSGHEDEVNSAYFNPDGKKIISASKDKTGKIWNVQTGQLLLTLKGHSNPLTYASFSPDGKNVATSSSPGFSGIGDQSTKLWDVLTGQLLFSTNLNTKGTSFNHFSPDNKYIVTASDDGTAGIWNVGTGELVVNLRANTAGTTSLSFSPNATTIVSTSKENTAHLWDLHAGIVKSVLIGHSDKILTAEFSPDGKNIATASTDYTCKIWNTENGHLLSDLAGHTGKINTVKFNPAGTKVISASDDNTAKIWDINTSKVLLDLTQNNSSVLYSEFSPNGKKVITFVFSSPYQDTKDNTAKIWDVSTGKLLSVLSGHSSSIGSAVFSPACAGDPEGGRSIVTSSYDKTCKIWNAETGALLQDLKGHTAGVVSAFFSTDGKQVISASHDGTAKIWEVQTGKMVTTLRGHRSELVSASFSPNGEKIVTASLDKSAILWDTQNDFSPEKFLVQDGYLFCAKFSPSCPGDKLGGKYIATANWNHSLNIYSGVNGRLLSTFIPLLENNYISITPDRYYQCSPDAAKILHYVSDDLKIITFEQLDVKYNRPDKVLQALDNTDTALINSYHKAWEKRIKKLRIDTTSFTDGYSVPETDFSNRNNITYDQNKDKLILHIKSLDSSSKLDRFNIWINEVPLYGQRGISLRKKGKNSFDSTITIKLSQGKNYIETSATNINGTESYRMPLIVNYSPATKQKEKIRFIGIGIDKFSDNQYNLQYSVKDIRDLAVKLKEKYKNAIIIDTLFNQNVTISNVKALKKKLQQTTENDKVIIAYSGHGMLSKEYDYYLSTYSVNFEKPEQNGLPYDELENLLDSIPARKKLLLIDACHSGEVDKEDMIALNRKADSLGLKGAKGVITENTEEGGLGLNNSFELMQSLFVNVGKSTGAAIISAAAGNQFALEGVNNLSNGVFTYCILEAMNKYPSMKISTLKKIVGERVEQLTNGMQKPTSRNETIAVDWNIW